MEPNIEQRIHTLETKIDAIYASVEKTRRYFLIMVWVTVIGVGLPLVGLFFAIPAFINSYVTTLGGL